MTDVIDKLTNALADRYTIERELGRGGMATVYLAHDQKLGRAVALKVLSPELAASLGSERFLREIEIAAKLTHPNILALHDCGAADGLLYYTMPFIEGESLRDRLNRERQLPIEDALRITNEVADALGYAHSLGLVHRDVKPENILFTAGHAVVSDFGIARAVSAAGVATLTETGLAVGTPAYMSPEQASGSKDIDARSDIYSLACVLYEMLSGETPYLGNTPQAIMAKKLTEPTPRVSVVRDTVPTAVEHALTKALSRTPADRFRTAREFGAALSSADVQPADTPQGRRMAHLRGWRGAAAAAVVVLLGLGGWWGAHRLREPALRRLAVLPLASFTNDSTQQYFVDGVHDALIFDLQQAGVSVIGRTSVLQYAHTEKPIHEIARELGVDGVIEGSVLRTGDSVELALRLIDAGTEETRWQKSYPGDMRNILTLYHGVTRGIAGEIQSTLSPQASARLASARTVDPQAYDDYLKGDFLLLRLFPGDLDAALEYFQRALGRDSTYAPAWAGIAQVWLLRAAGWQVSPRGATPQIRAALRRALELDSNSAQVQSVTGNFRWWVEWDWAGAERAYRRAIEINPNYGDARSFYAAFLDSQGRFGEAYAQAGRAIELDPLNPWPRAIYAVTLSVERRHADALREFRRALEIAPDYLMATSNMWSDLHHLGRYDEVVAMLRRLYADDPGAQDALTQGLAEGGYQAALRRLAQYLGPRSPYALGAGVVVADYYALAGEKDSALAWLERAYQARDIALVAVDQPDFDSLRDDPRFRDLCRRMNLPRCAQGSASPRGTARPGT